ncbi:proto-oncogene Mas-like [Zootoca vivipara]|uniref:proto-oncogene Mas-like n=1 Tax=Zootoca vivipara TaxID=8524 RepID=UPI00159020A0|nr:proto-oncogene Mas-like [Zootoca vivipara]
MTNLSLTSVSPLSAGEDYYGADNETVFYNNSHSDDDSASSDELERNILMISCMLISILGLWGNGTVIWLLGFCIKRNQFTTFILNLSIADFGSLTANFILGIYLIGYSNRIGLLYALFDDIFLVMYNAGQFLLIAISIDRCVSILFPLWHRCHRPVNLSTTVCAIIWVLSFLPPAANFTLWLTVDMDYQNISIYQYILNGFLCLPLMTISTLVLFIKFCFKPQQQRRRKLLIVILLTLFFFLFFSFPLNGIYIALFVFDSPFPHRTFYVYLCVCMNGSVNRLTYFLIGRQKRGRPRKSMKATLQNLFKEEENSQQKLDISVETQL